MSESILRPSGPQRIFLSNTPTDLAGASMRITDFVELIKLPLLAAFVAFSAGTGLALTCRPSSILVQRGLTQFNLATECNLATWFEASVFLLCALTFVPLGCSQAAGPHIQRRSRVLFVIFALGCCFLSLDESVAIHERLGDAFERKSHILAGTALDERGFTWVLLYAPAGFAGVGAMVWLYGGLIGRLPPSDRARRWARLSLWIVVASIATVFATEIIEAVLVTYGRQDTPLGFVEETAELAVLYSLIACNTIIAKRLSL